METLTKNTMFPHRLATARKLQGLSQNGLGNKIGLNQMSISRFETGASKPSFDNLLRLVDGLGISLDSLVGRGFDKDDKIWK